MERFVIPVEVETFVMTEEFLKLEKLPPKWKTIMIQRIQEKKSFNEIAVKFKLSDTRIGQIFLKGLKYVKSHVKYSSAKGQDIFEVFIEDCPLSGRLKTALYRENIMTIGEVCCLNTQDLVKQRNFGHGTLQELVKFLDKIGVVHNFSKLKTYHELKKLASFSDTPVPQFHWKV